MEDNHIVELYWARSERAISETSSKYGKYCYSISYRILVNIEDANECVNDTYLGAWNSMPPHRPSILSTFLGKITRRISINRWKRNNRDKRGASEITLALDELSDCIQSPMDTESVIESNELAKAINTFLSVLPDTERDVFVCRYWFLASISEISQKFDFSQSKTKSMLMRTRRKLYQCLQKEGLI